MGMSRWWMLGALVPLVAGCGGGGTDTDDRISFGAFMGFGTSTSSILDSLTVVRFEQILSCKQADASNVLVDPEVDLEATITMVSVPLGFRWINNEFDSQRVEVLDHGFKATVYRDEGDDPDTLVWSTYDSFRAPEMGKKVTELTDIRTNESLEEADKDAQIAALTDYPCYQPEPVFEESGVVTVLDIPQSERLPPTEPDLWPNYPEVANTSFILFNGWSGDGAIEAVAGNYYVDFEMTINLPGESKPDSVRRTLVIQDAE